MEPIESTNDQFEISTEEESIPEIMAHPICVYEGKEYTHGAYVCQAGVKMYCNNGSWESVGSC